MERVKKYRWTIVATGAALAAMILVLLGCAHHEIPQPASTVSKSSKTIGTYMHTQEVTVPTSTGAKDTAEVAITPEDTENSEGRNGWQLYADEAFGISFTYPASWTFNKRTVEAKMILVGRPFRERLLSQALQALADYDVIIIDVAPSVDLLQLSSLIASDSFLIPVALDHLAVVGASDALISAAAIGQ